MRTCISSDVSSVARKWGQTDQTEIEVISPDQLDEMRFDAGSMAPKIAAACEFVRAGGRLACIGRLHDARAIIEGRAGTQVRDDSVITAGNLSVAKAGV